MQKVRRRAIPGTVLLLHCEFFGALSEAPR